MNVVEPTRSPRYRLVDQDDLIMCSCLDAKGLFIDIPQEAAPPYELIGCTLSQQLLDYLNGSNRYRRRNPLDLGDLQVVDAMGEHLGGFWIGGQIIDWCASERGPSLIDLTVDAPMGRPSSVSEPIWERWRAGWPESPTLWAEYGAEGRRAWIEVVAGCTFHRSRPPDDLPGATYELEGAPVIDETSFYLAIGEAINGPGGYFGWNLSALADCTSGGFGATTPFTLMWRHSDVAHSHLIERFEEENGQKSPPFFDLVVELLERRGVEVVLC
ncbi:barstar family protein [Streptosporangium sp. 'caverna']|uniref:barstar family protein n=1 Tax=Streptosporangium sp. 'caverna' TaxID=2202249 RepID=UPI000D7E0878|nr:barstar family protein [Streptosporangium sp. 'caverna']AWS45124.1 hypothetical protein DKM19_31240 [Streptosporangium sp. 'caverna']